MDGGRLRRPHLLGIYFMAKMHTKTIQKIQKAYIQTYAKDLNIYGGGQKMGSTKTRHLAIREKIMTNS